VFPARYEQLSPLQPSGAVEGWRDNPVDDQNTVYGLTVAQGDPDEIFVSQRERGLVRHLQIVPAADGRLGYAIKRTFLFRSFGQPYRATPDDDEFECEYNGTAEPGDVVAVGSAANAGRFLEADLEGLSLIGSVPGRILMLASSQGDSSFHFYEIGRAGVRWCRTGKRQNRPARATSTATSSTAPRSSCT
jgi:myo-inositol-hexaphosphate 3-phosphohydrolase